MSQENIQLSLPATVGDLLKIAREKLSQVAFGPSPREAYLLLAFLLGRDEAGVMARPELPVAAADVVTFHELLIRRLKGEPFAYLVGEREFYGRLFRVDRRVLIPRPETEHVVELALELSLPPAPRILDIGTGSGCLAVTLAAEIERARVWASDLSVGALAVAKLNCQRHRVAARVGLVAANLAQSWSLRDFDLVVSNPPYVDPAQTEELSLEVRDFEPHRALFAPQGGRLLLQRLLLAMEHMKSGAFLMLEIGYDQGEWLRGLAEATPFVKLLKIHRDYGGIERTVVLQRQ